MPALPTVDPQAPQAAPQPPEAPTTPPAAAPPATPPAGPQLDPRLIKIPAFQAVVSGIPPAISMHLKGADDREDVKLLAENKDQLTQMGFGFYRSMDGTTGVMYNSMHIHPQDLAAADKAGKLRQIAPDADVVNHQVAKLGLLHPVHTMHPSRVPTAPAQPSYQAPPQGAALNLQPPAAGVQRKLASARLAALQPSAPTSGPAPGGGQLLNSVLKQVV